MAVSHWRSANIGECESAMFRNQQVTICAKPFRPEIALDPRILLTGGTHANGSKTFHRQPWRSGRRQADEPRSAGRSAGSVHDSATGHRSNEEISEGCRY